MRIDSGLPVQSNAEIEQTQKKSATAASNRHALEATSDVSADVVQLSSLELHSNSAPDIREQKIDKLREAIKSGTYEVSNEALADAILRDVLRR